jgi:hypothetical protein
MFMTLVAVPAIYRLTTWRKPAASVGSTADAGPRRPALT